MILVCVLVTILCVSVSYFYLSGCRDFWLDRVFSGYLEPEGRFFGW